MAMSLAIIILLGLFISKLFKKLGLPGLLGMLILGVTIGPYGLNLLHENMINISADLRKIALIVILLRAGFGLDKEDLQRNGIVALKMGSIPVIIEGIFIAFASIKFLDFNFIQGGMLGFIIAAVSPAVVVPSMLSLIDTGHGAKKGIPTLILAGASIDDVFAITIFSAFVGVYSGKGMNLSLQLLSIPISIILGIILGGIIGIILVKVFKKYHIQDTKKVLIVFALATILTDLENLLKLSISIASLLGVMAIGFILADSVPDIGKKLSAKLGKIWIVAEVLLFVLVGAEVNIGLAFNAGKIGILIIFVGLLGRSIGVIISLLGTDLNWKERLFCIISYLPKATVQAAMGAVPLSLGVESGDIILALAVLSIVITAPLGAIGINYTSKRLL